MTREEIIEAVNKTFVEILEVPAEELSPEKAIFKDLGLDSLDMDEIMECYSTGGIYDFFVKMEQEHSGQKSPEQKKQDS